MTRLLNTYQNKISIEEMKQRQDAIRQHYSILKRFFYELCEVYSPELSRLNSKIMLSVDICGNFDLSTIFEIWKDMEIVSNSSHEFRFGKKMLLQCKYAISSIKNAIQLRTKQKEARKYISYKFFYHSQSYLESRIRKSQGEIKEYYEMLLRYNKKRFTSSVEIIQQEDADSFQPVVRLIPLQMPNNILEQYFKFCKAIACVHNAYLSSELIGKPITKIKMSKLIFDEVVKNWPSLKEKALEKVRNGNEKEVRCVTGSISSFVTMKYINDCDCAIKSFELAKKISSKQKEYKNKIKYKHFYYDREFLVKETERPFFAGYYRKLLAYHDKYHSVSKLFRK